MPRIRNENIIELEVLVIGIFGFFGWLVSWLYSVSADILAAAVAVLGLIVFKLVRLARRFPRLMSVILSGVSLVLVATLVFEDRLNPRIFGFAVVGLIFVFASCFVWLLQPISTRDTGVEYAPLN
jgi:hypothetical protein